ncbi:MAG TPA: hypothetical protein VER17_18020 [Tepidisphaeraceae bacterium]|nr:hypothetical protein [Tepidisphaeraceae bacterium]
MLIILHMPRETHGALRPAARAVLWASVGAGATGGITMLVRRRSDAASWYALWIGVAAALLASMLLN